MTTTLAPTFDVPDDVVPERPDTEPLRCQFDGCTNSVVKPVRGRTPKYCPDHKQAAKTPTGTRKASWPEAEMVEDSIKRYFATLTFAVTMVNPIDGEIIASGSDAVAHELVELGRVDKKVRAWLTKIAAPGKYGPLILATLPIVVGIMANHGLLPQFVIGPKVQLDTEGVN